MKKTLLTLPLALGLFVAQAQSGGSGLVHGSKPYKKNFSQSGAIVTHGHQDPALSEERAVPFWTEDFSGGFPAGWTTSDVGTTPPDPLVTFVWTSDPNAVEPASLSWTESAPFQSTTASNGYIWANADRGLSQAPVTNMQTRLFTTPIDCSGQNTVLLTFESTIGVYDIPGYESAIVKVSTDNVNWTDYIPFPCLDTPQGSTYNPPCDRWSYNAQLVQLDITATAANSPTVYLQFQWNGGWDYFWAIDDMAMSSLPDYERIVDYAYVSHVGYGLEYARIPRPQLGTEFMLGGQAHNFGSNPQTNFVMNVDVTAPGGGSAFSASQNFGTVNSGDTVNMEQAVTLPANLDEGVYAVALTVTSDQDAMEEDPSDDMAERAFELNDLSYTLDGIGVHPGDESLTSLGTGSYTDGEDGLFALTYYPISQTVTVYGVDVYVTSGSSVDADLFVSIHDSSNVVADDLSAPYVATSQDHFLTAQEISDGYARILFDTPYDLQPGNYYVGVEMYSSNNANDVSVVDDATVPQPSLASVIYISNGSSPGTYTNGNALLIRPILDPTAGIEGLADVPGFNVYPNPTKDGIVNVNTSTNDTYSLMVTDQLGALVYSTKFTSSMVLDLARFAKGAYTVYVTNGRTQASQVVTRF